jgi:hypothetical protein
MLLICFDCVPFEGKRPPGRPRHRREDNINIDLEEIGWEVVGCIYLAQVGTSVELL